MQQRGQKPPEHLSSEEVSMIRQDVRWFENHPKRKWRLRSTSVADVRAFTGSRPPPPKFAQELMGIRPTVAISLNRKTGTRARHLLTELVSGPEKYTDRQIKALIRQDATR